MHDLERQLEEEVRAIRAMGLIEREERNEGSELAAARNRLDAVLRDIDSVGTTPEGPAFGGPATQRPEWKVNLAAGLEERAGLLAELDATLELLRDATREPSASDRPRLPGSLGKLRSATNLLCGKAWLAARVPEGGGEAGHWLAQALVMLRVTDNGLGFGLAVRVGLERIVVDTLERLRAEGLVDRETLDA
ncbi:MAG TPA: hypothetical protein VMT18_13610, partial [Planctomycetota bacterium]|nr:hypothetical protein [Planctomycetota bacterium]